MMFATITLALLSSPAEIRSSAPPAISLVESPPPLATNLEEDYWHHTFPEAVAVEQLQEFIYGVSAVTGPVNVPTYYFQRETPDVCTGDENPPGETPPWYSEFGSLRDNRPLFQETYGGITLNVGYTYKVTYEHKKFVTPNLVTGGAKDRLNLFNELGEAQFPAITRDLTKVTDPVLDEKTYEHSGPLFPGNPGGPEQPGQGG